MKKLGLIVNPVAGMGGKVGLKGTDGADVLKMALHRGAVPHSPARAKQALLEIRKNLSKLTILTFPGDMGENEAIDAGFSPEILLKNDIEDTTSKEDTFRAARELLEEGVDLILFAGGDGTARDIYEAISEQAVVLGIPAGVKIHSAVFASSPVNAGELASLFLKGTGVRKKLAEVMDIDEEAFRQDLVKSRLFGYLKIPYEKKRVQNLKSGSSPSEETSQEEIAVEIMADIKDDVLYLVGPGSTTKTLMKHLNIPNTLLGIDAIFNKQCISNDLKEKEILELLDNYSAAKIIVTPIGGQGFIFGRGNQQLSSSVIQRIGKDNIIVVCTTHKLHSFNGEPLLVDTGSQEVDEYLSGFIKVITGIKESVIYSIDY